MVYELNPLPGLKDLLKNENMTTLALFPKVVEDMVNSRLKRQIGIKKLVYEGTIKHIKIHSIDRLGRDTLSVFYTIYKKDNLLSI
ncbi:MAG: hypothetical protein C7M88_08335 [Candidatus Arcticimaribacter sp.]|nr:hypothetical protein [Flavobacteriaceae bacterium]PSR08921.1 MAG: hypothetical protein C7M88_08335 [Candidatus Arcticimaribacter sp.]PTM02367.1 MAG: hypothetical protein DA394_00940 [Candidatus Arcticimaribacter sp.]